MVLALFYPIVRNDIWIYNTGKSRAINLTLQIWKIE